MWTWVKVMTPPRTIDFVLDLYADETLQWGVMAVFAKMFRFLPDIRSGRHIFFTRPIDK